MKIGRALAAAVLGLSLVATLAGCRSVSPEAIEAADSKLLLLKSGPVGDSWVMEDSLGMRTPLKSCGIPLVERCFEIPGSTMKLTYPLFGSSVIRDGKLSGTAWGKELYCRDSPLPWDPEAICAVL